MTDKQIIIDYENICENYSKEVGCYNTFDGSCMKEKCQIFRLLQTIKAKEQECEELKKNVEHWKMEHKEAKAKCKWTYDLVKKRPEQQLDQLKADREEALKQLEFVRTLNTVKETEIRKLTKTLTEIKEIAENGKRFAERLMITGEQKANVLTYANAILQKISEVGNEYNTKDIRHINEKNQKYIAEGNRMTKMNREQKERLMEKIEYDIKSDMIAQEEKKKIKRSECPYGGIDCAWCLEDCE